MARPYHVAKYGNNKNQGTEEQPFLTIQKAAEAALPGDTVIIHEGEYREWVKPVIGGIDSNTRITYESAEGEHVVIKGSEVADHWEKYRGTIWKTEIPNEVFGDYNPYEQEIFGDWLVDPRNYTVHTGDVYLDGKSFYEAADMEELENPQMLYASRLETWADREEKIRDPENTIYKWLAEVKDDVTVIYANFHEKNPEEHLIEINVRKCCFYPDKTGVNYITVRGLEMAQAATPWAPPTADQPGLLGPNWSKGWIIENNIIHDSKCSGISLGKEASTGDNDFSKWKRKPGYQYQMEAVFRAKKIGWSKEKIGSHIVRNNCIYDCGQNGIVGHLGCIFSEIYHNEIYNIAVKHEFYGHEIGGIKLHAAIDVQIHDNYIHHCSLGTWLDWQAQGTRVSRNIYVENNRDLFVEVSHGPYIVDNNILASPYNLDIASSGGAYIHNLCCGLMRIYTVMNRSTPYHLAHSTDVLGTSPIYGGDDRFLQNIFVGGEEEEHYGTDSYNGYPASFEEYLQRIQDKGPGDVEIYEQIRKPAMIRGNVYLKGAKPCDTEKIYMEDQMDPQVRIEEDGQEIYLKMCLPSGCMELDTGIIDSRELGRARTPEAVFESPDGTPILFSADLPGMERGEHPVPGPVDGLVSGKQNVIKIWKRNC